MKTPKIPEMRLKFFFPICLILAFTPEIFSQETGFRKIFIIENTASGIIKEAGKNTVNAELSQFNEEEITNFKKSLSSFKGVLNVSISPLSETNYKCVLVLNKEVKKRALVKVLQSAGVEYVAIDDTKCRINEYLKITEEKRSETK